MLENILNKLNKTKLKYLNTKNIVFDHLGRILLNCAMSAFEITKF